eukprot:3442908-Rhodomonas_salina.4
MSGTDTARAATRLCGGSDAVSRRTCLQEPYAVRGTEQGFCTTRTTGTELEYCATIFISTELGYRATRTIGLIMAKDTSLLCFDEFQVPPYPPPTNFLSYLRC